MLLSFYYILLLCHRFVPETVAKSVHVNRTGKPNADAEEEQDEDKGIYKAVWKAGGAQAQILMQIIKYNE